MSCYVGIVICVMHGLYHVLCALLSETYYYELIGIQYFTRSEIQLDRTTKMQTWPRLYSIVYVRGVADSRLDRLRKSSRPHRMLVSEQR